MTLLTASPSYAVEYTLEELLEIAQKESTPVCSILKEIDNLKLDLEILKTNYNPKFFFNGQSQVFYLEPGSDGVNYSNNGNLSASIKFPSGLEVLINGGVNGIFKEKQDYNYSLTLKYPIYPGMKTDSTLLQIEDKKQSLSIAQWTLKEKELEAYIQVWKKFYLTLIIKEKLQLAKEALEQVTEDLNLYKDLYLRGDITQRDLLIKEIEYKSALISWEQNNQQYLNSLKDLLNFVGIELNELTEKELEKINLKGTLDRIREIKLVPFDKLKSVEEMKEEAIKNNVSYNETKFELLDAEEELKRLYYTRGPEVDSQFTYESVPGQNVGKSQWTFTVNLSYQLGDGGELALEMEKQTRLIDDLKSSLIDVEFAIVDELQNRLTDIKIAYLNYQTAQLEYEKALLDQNLKKEQYNKGMITESQFLSGERLLKNKELDYLQRKIEYQVNYWELNKFVYLEIKTDGVMAE